MQCKEQLRFVSASRFYLFCCDFDVPCDCRQGSAAYCQCEEASYASFSRDCSAPPLKVSRVKAFSRVRTTVSMAACGCPVCEKHRTLYQRDRPGWLRRLGKLMLCSFTNQVLAQPDLLEGKHGLQKRSSLLARELNEIAAYLRLPALGAELTVFTQECCLYPVELPLICLRRKRNPTPISALRANMSFVHCCLCPAVLTNCSQSGLDVPTRHQAGYTGVNAEGPFKGHYSY